MSSLLLLAGCGGSKQPNPGPSRGGSSGSAGASAGHGGMHGGSGGAGHGGTGGSGTSGEAGEAGSGLGGEENAGSGQGATSGKGGSGSGGTHGGGTGGDTSLAGESGIGGENPGVGGTTASGGSSGHGGASGSSGHAGTSSGQGGTAGDASAGAGGSIGVGGSAGAGTGGSAGLGGSAGGSVGGSAGVGGSGGTGGSSGMPGSVDLNVIASPNPGVTGGSLLYEFKLTNSGGTTLTNVVLTDVTQNAATVYAPETTGGGACGATYCGAGTIFTWPAFTLSPGQTQTVWMTSTVNAGTANGTVVHNTATVAYSGKTQMKSTDVTVDGSVSLRVGIVEDKNPVRAGDLVTYTVSLGNTGTQNLPLSTQGVLSATVPAGATFVSATAGGTASNGSVQWNFSSVNPGGTQHYAYTVSMASDLPDGRVLVPTATVLDAGSAVATASTLTEIRASVPLTLSVITNPDPDVAGGAVSYEYKVSNTSNATLTNVVLTNVAQNNMTGYVPETTGGGTCGATYCGAGTIVTWPAFTLAPGQTQTVWLTGTVDPGTASGTLIYDQARLAYSGGMVLASSHLTVDSAAKLAVDVIEDHNPVRPSDQLTYSVTVGNIGTQSLPLSASAVLTATIPPGTSFVSASNGGTGGSGVVTWDVGSVNPGGTLHYTYTVSVGGGLADGSVLEPFVQLLDGYQSVARASSLTEVRASVPLRLTTVPHPDPAVPGGPLMYEFKVSNVGSTSLTNVVLTNVTRNGATGYVPETTNGGTCGATYCGAGTLVTWPAFTLAAGQTQTVWLTNTVNAGTLNGTVIHNDARLVYSGGLVLSTEDTAVDGTAKLNVGMVQDKNPVHAGDQLTYTITLGNTGTQALPLSTAGVLTATLPPGTSFVSASGGGSSANGVVTWNVGWVNAGATQHYTYTVSLPGGLADGTLLEASSQLSDSGTSLARGQTSTEVRASTPLTLDVTIAPDPVGPSALTTYTMVVTNTGATSLTNVVLTSVTENAATAVASQLTGGGACGATYCGAGTIITWPAFTLASGQATTVTRTDTINAGTVNGTIVRNQARLTYGSGTVVKAADISVHN